jgi:hypothetical protein
MNPLSQFENTTTPPVLLSLLVAFFGLCEMAQAVVPAPDGGYPRGNTAEGQSALFSLTTGGYNTAVGFFSLRSETIGSFNTAIGAGALLANFGVGGGGGDQNTATGTGALLSNTNGFQNTADGAFALSSNTIGGSNTALGSNAGSNITGSGNICIGATVTGVAGENNTTRIGNIYDSIATDRAVYVNSDNKLGTILSSRRYKEEIKPMDKTSEVLLALKPVTFRYKQELDPRHVPMFGLIAEDVEKVNPDLVTRNKKGEVETVRYEAVNAMLLNEFLKEHRRVQEQNWRIQQQEATITQLKKDFRSTVAQLTTRLDEQAARIQKVSVQLTSASQSDGELEISRPAPQMVINNP